MYNPALGPFLFSEPPTVRGQSAVALVDNFLPLNLSTLVAGGTYFHYKGSLTSPPCTEDVTWFVRREPVMASDAQVKLLTEAMATPTRGKMNYRTCQPLATRPV